ncbi:hypothetical protein NBRC13296_11955 [Paenibacillus chitinolyticus]|uniref:hypothetical protein n=1 Tax=Paenibacillus chitinolyticus TaxID=79263 RepID=UPI0035587541
MKKHKVGITWVFIIIILAAGYFSQRHQRSKTTEQGELGGQQITAPQQIKASSESAPQKTENKKPPQSLDGEGITVIGDSVIVGIQPYLKEKLPKITVDGKVGRQMSQAQKLIDDLKAEGKLGNRIIIELGTNGPFNQKSLRSLLQSLSDKQVFVVTTRVSKGWQDTVNTTIKDVAGEFHHVKIVDWYAASEGKKDIFYEDGVHLKPDGSRYYASLLIEALQKQ